MTCYCQNSRVFKDIPNHQGLGELFDIENDVLLTTAQLAETLNVSEKTIRDWRYSQKLPAIKLRKLVRYRLGDILEWLKTNGG